MNDELIVGLVYLFGCLVGAVTYWLVVDSDRSFMEQSLKNRNEGLREEVDDLKANVDGLRSENEILSRRLTENLGYRDYKDKYEALTKHLDELREQYAPKLTTTR